MLSKRPDREDVPVLGVTDGAVPGKDADDLLWHKTENTISTVMNKRRQNSDRMPDCQLVSVWNLSTFDSGFHESVLTREKFHCSVRGILTC